MNLEAHAYCQSEAMGSSRHKLVDATVKLFY